MSDNHRSDTHDQADNGREKGRITGYHATAMFVVFFGVIITVNLVMARYALSSFGGTVVDNSYVASQKYNDWLEAARAQQRYGWTISEPLRDDDRIVMRITLGDGGAPMTGGNISAEAMHPVGRSDSFTIGFSEAAPGVYRSIEAVPEGRWILQMIIRRGDQRYRMRSEIL